MGRSLVTRYATYFPPLHWDSVARAPPTGLLTGSGAIVLSRRPQENNGNSFRVGGVVLGRYQVFSGFLRGRERRGRENGEQRRRWQVCRYCRHVGTLGGCAACGIGRRNGRMGEWERGLRGCVGEDGVDGCRGYVVGLRWYSSAGSWGQMGLDGIGSSSSSSEV